MLKDIKFCLLMTIAKVLSAGVTMFIFSTIMMIGSGFYFSSILSDSMAHLPLWKYILLWFLGVVLMIVGARISLYCFRSALAIADTTKAIQRKPGKKQGE
jgi:hypothetical protein